MSRWFRMYEEILEDAKVQKLPAAEFKQEFLKALNGEPSLFAKFIKGPFVRPDAHDWRIIREGIFQRDNYTCVYCGAHGVALECDHVVPVAKGGNHDEGNLATACFVCNRSKGGKLISEWHR
jgi:hypothetical protein